jgi:hypothetical protein
MLFFVVRFHDGIATALQAALIDPSPSICYGTMYFHQLRFFSNCGFFSSLRLSAATVAAQSLFAAVLKSAEPADAASPTTQFGAAPAMLDRTQELLLRQSPVAALGAAGVTEHHTVAAHHSKQGTHAAQGGAASAPASMLAAAPQTIPPTAGAATSVAVAAAGPLSTAAAFQQLQRLHAFLAPALCLNRYHTADGVRRQAHDAWRLAVGMRGPAVVSALLPAVVALYVQQSAAATPEQREVRSYFLYHRNALIALVFCCRLCLVPLDCLPCDG